jgi:Flp pilus assembly protein TadD
VYRLKTCLLWLFSAAVQAQTVSNAKPAPLDVFRSELEQQIARQRYDGAEEIISRQLQGGGDGAAIFFEAGKVYFDHAEWQRSATYLDKSLALRRDNDQAHQLLGLDLRALHRPELAEGELLQAAKLNPANKANVFFAGHQLVLNGKFEAALPYLYSAIQSQSLQADALAALGFAQARLGNYALAETYYQKAIDSGQISDDARYSAMVNLSIILLLGHDSARIKQALAYSDRAKKLRPDSADAHFLAGKALFKLGRLQEAGNQLKRAATLNPEDRKAHFLLAQIYDQMGQGDRAREERKQIARIQSRPDQPGMTSADRVPMTPE